MPQLAQAPDLSLWDPPVMDAVMLVGAILIVVVGVHTFGQLMRESALRRWWEIREWTNSVLLGGLFLVMAWIAPRALAHELGPMRRGLAVVALLAGVAVFGLLLGWTVRKDATRRAGAVAGLIAAACLLVLVFAWMIGVGVYFLGPGLI